VDVVLLLRDTGYALLDGRMELSAAATVFSRRNLK